MGNKDMRHKRTLIISLLLAPFILYGVFLALVVHGDGYRIKTISMVCVKPTSQASPTVKALPGNKMCA